MKYLFAFLPVFLGIVSVLQASLNKNVSVHWSLGSAVFLNTVVLLAVTLLAWLTGLLPARASSENFQVWFLLPGLFGFCLVVGLPIAIQRFGGMHTFVWLIAAQIISSGLWDRFVEGIPFTWQRVLGGILAAGGAWIVSL